MHFSLITPTPGHEREISFLKHEFLFERLVEVDPGLTVERELRLPGDGIQRLGGDPAARDPAGNAEQQGIGLPGDVGS